MGVRVGDLKSVSGGLLSTRSCLLYSLLAVPSRRVQCGFAKNLDEGEESEEGRNEHGTSASHCRCCSLACYYREERYSPSGLRCAAVPTRCCVLKREGISFQGGSAEAVRGCRASVERAYPLLGFREGGACAREKSDGTRTSRETVSVTPVSHTIEVNDK